MRAKQIKTYEYIRQLQTVQSRICFAAARKAGMQRTTVVECCMMSAFRTLYMP